MSDESGVSYLLFPSIDSSQPIGELHNSSIEWQFSPKIQVNYKNCAILKIDVDVSIPTIEWFGDSIVFLEQGASEKNSEFRAFYHNFSLILEIPEPYLDLVRINRSAIDEFHIVFKRSGNVFTFDIPNQLQISLSGVNLENFIHSWWQKIQELVKSAPRTNHYVVKALWNYHWVLHGVQCPSGTLRDSWYTPSWKNYQVSKIYQPVERMHIIDDIMWYRPDFAKEQLNCIFNLLRVSDGFFGNGKESHPHLSFPPILSYILMEYSKFTGDVGFISRVYNDLKRNIEWWENNRFNEDYQLFGSNMSADEIGYETTMRGSPRFLTQFDGSSWHSKKPSDSRSMLLVDLNSQMCDYYQNMGVFGMMVGDSESSQYFQKAEALQEIGQEFLWDQNTNFFYDYDLETDQLQPVKTVAGFWPLYGGLASKSQVNPLVAHLTDPNEFWAELPIPTLALNDPNYKKQPWNGPVLLSQNYWILNGLRRYNLNSVAARFSKKIFEYLNTSFDLYHGVYHYYPPMSYNVNAIQANNKTIQSRGCALGHAPLHSIFFRGLLGAEILDDSINFIPDFSVLDKEVRFSFYYRGKRIDGYLSKLDKKMLEFFA